MKTECNTNQLELQGLGRQKVIVKNDSKVNSSDAGFLLLKQIEQKHKIIKRLESCFTDNRAQWKVIHSLKSLLTQRIFGICQGYEDLNDHDQLRDDPLLQFVCGSRGKTAGKSTLNRLETGMADDEELGDRYSKIKWEEKDIEEALIDLSLDTHKKPPETMILDFDATDLSVHGDQQYKFYNGHYDHYCFLPLYVFCDDFPLAVKLRPSDVDGAEGTEEILENLVEKIRIRFPDTKIIFRADSGFCREGILALCERLEIFYIVGMPQNSRLNDIIWPQMSRALELYEKTLEASRVFSRFPYKTVSSWSCERQIVAKAEYLPGHKKNHRYVVTNLPEEEGSPQWLYEEIYCGRGDMENRIKEQLLDLFADRASVWWMSGNQLRLWFSAFAHIFFNLLQRAITTVSDEEGKKMPATIRLRILKVAACVKITVRHVWVSLPESFPYWDLWGRVAGAI